MDGLKFVFLFYNFFLFVSKATYSASQQALNHQNALAQWKRIILLVIAITVHNIPEGLAVGVSFGAIGNTESATFESARY